MLSIAISFIQNCDFPPRHLFPLQCLNKYISCSVLLLKMKHVLECIKILIHKEEIIAIITQWAAH